MQEIKSKFRIALLGIYHESNTFLPKSTTIDDFKRGHLLKGKEICAEYENAHHEIGGMLEVLEKNNIPVVPIFFAEATPGGVITSDAFNALLKSMLDGLKNAGQIDGCLVIPHGAAVSDEFMDMDGHWLSLIRQYVGAIPIVGTLDPHANVSPLMIKVTDALIAYSTNPHIDQRETGKKAAELLVGMLRSNIQPRQQLLQVALAISIEQQNTAIEPCKSLYQLAADMLKDKSLLSLSIILGFPYADVPEMGTSFIIITDGLRSKASVAADEMSEYIMQNRTSFVGEKKDVRSELQNIIDSPKPVLLLDMGDNIGGGSEGNSTYLLEALENNYEFKVFSCVFDPLAVKEAIRQPVNDRFRLSFGSNYNAGNRNAYATEVALLKIVDGKFEEDQPRHGGQKSYDMGTTAILITAKGNVVMLTSRRIAPFSLAQLTSFGINPADFDVIIAKGVNAPIAAYGPVCKTIMQLDTPGVTQADMTLFTYYNRRKPLFPFEN